jgi:hypothetical protein
MKYSEIVAEDKYYLVELKDCKKCCCKSHTFIDYLYEHYRITEATK